MTAAGEHEQRPGSEPPSVLDETASDHEIARHLAAAAGELLVALRDDLVASGTTQWALKDAGDIHSHEFLVAELARLRPDDAVLSEEGRDDWSRVERSRVWIVDPLDGTREFGEGRPDWAVHVALAVDGAPLIGAVSLPAIGPVLDTGHPPVVPTRPDGRPLRLAVSRTRPTMASLLVARALDGELVAMGSAGFKAMAVVTGEVDAYVHAGGQYEWDNCAPAAVALSAGLHVSRLDGSPLTYNHPDPYLPDFVICRPELAEPVLELVSPLL